MSDFWKDYEPEPTRAALMTKDEALDLALEALKKSTDNFPANVQHRKAITAIKQARALDKKAENARELGLDYEPVLDVSLIDEGKTAAPVQEPMAFFDWYDNAHWGNEDFKEGCHRSWNAAIKYTTQPAAQRPFVGLTDEDIYPLLHHEPRHDLEMIEFIRIVEAKLKEKNT
jgi:hypothetical protein